MPTAKHADADKKRLGKDKWFASFSHEHERRTAIPAVELDKDDTLARYYSPTTTPTEGVDADIEKWGLDDVTQGW